MKNYQNSRTLFERITNYKIIFAFDKLVKHVAQAELSTQSTLQSFQMSAMKIQKQKTIDTFLQRKAFFFVVVFNRDTEKKFIFLGNQTILPFFKSSIKLLSIPKATELFEFLNSFHNTVTKEM